MEKVVLVERYDPTKDLEEALGGIIHIYNMPTHGRKSLTVVTGLVVDKKQEKLFLDKGKDKFSTAGYKKIIPEYDQKHESYVFNGDKRLDSKELIMKLFNYPEDKIIIH